MDIKQFTRELLEGKDMDTAVMGTITHAIRILLPDPSFPPTWLLQHETNDAIYSDVFITRDPKLVVIKEGDSVMFQKIAPEKEGHPFFLYVATIPVDAPPAPVEEVINLATEDTEEKTKPMDFDLPDPSTHFNAEEKDTLKNGAL